LQHLQGIERYVKKKKLDPLDTYVPLVLEARERLASLDTVMGGCARNSKYRKERGVLQLDNSSFVIWNCSLSVNLLHMDQSVVAMASQKASSASFSLQIAVITEHSRSA
jgi:hypothetical protein